MAALPGSVRVYLALVVTAAFGLPVWLLLPHGLPVSEQLPVAGILAAGMLLAWLYPLPIGFKTHYYLDTALIVASALLLEPGTAMLVTGAGTLGGQLIRRRYLDETLFNTAQTMLQTALAGWMLHLAGYAPGDIQVGEPFYVFTALAIGLALYISGAVLVGTIVGLQSGQQPLLVSLESILETEGSVHRDQFAQIGIGLVVAVLGATQPWTIILLAPAVAVVYMALERGLEMRREVALALRLQEKNLTEAQRLANVGSWEWDLSSGAQGWSSEAFAILGYTEPVPAPGIGHLLERVHPDDRAKLDALIHSAIRRRGSFDLEHRLLLPNSDECIVHHRGEVVSDDGLRLVAMLHDISDQHSLKLKLEQLAFHDPLTGLLNRARLAEEIASSLESWRHGGGSPFALLFVDLDGFKEVNDTLGHTAGDRILTDVGQRLGQVVREEDLVARYGGDEFLILARSVTRPEDARFLAARLVKSLNSASIIGGGAAVTVTASIGVVVPESRAATADELLHHVDTALYAAKRAGKNRFFLYGEGSDEESAVAAR